MRPPMRWCACSCSCPPEDAGLLGLLLLLKFLDLTPLLLDLLLLRLDLLLGLLIGGLVILHFVANRVTGPATERSADCRARGRCTYCRADDRTAHCADARAAQGSLLTRRERLP